MLHQSNAAKGKLPAPVCYEAGCVCTAIFEHVFTTAFTAASDKLEIGILPAGVQIVDATLIGANFGAITADLGILDGDAGEKDDARALTGTLLLNDQSVNNAEGNATKAACLAIAKADTHRGIGLTFSADIAAGATKKATVVIKYVA